MKCFVTFLSTPTAETPGTTLILHFDSKRYLIGNVAEGTQRAAIQRKQKLSSVGDVFLTGTVNWTTAGGLLGTMLTIADSTSWPRAESKAAKGEESVTVKRWLNVHGGKNLTHMMATARRFVFRWGMPVLTQEFITGQDAPKPNWEPTWKDDLVKVWAMLIEPEDAIQGSRKRSRDEFAADSAALADQRKDAPRGEEHEEDVNDEIRRAVVAEMFDSTRPLDALFTKKLSEIVKWEEKLVHLGSEYARPQKHRSSTDKIHTECFVRNEQGKIEKYTGPMPGIKEDVPDIEVLVRKSWPGLLLLELPPTTPATASVCYVIKNHPQRGKFDFNAAMKLGVPKGPLFRTLTEGNSITLEDGSVVLPEQVLGETKEGHGIAVIELPNSSYVEPLLRRKEWSSKEVMSGIGVVIWILGPGLAADSRIQDFMRQHDKLGHIVSSRDVCSNFLAMESQASAAVRHNLIDPERFPIPAHSNKMPELLCKDDLPFVAARVGKSVYLQPDLKITDEKTVPYLDIAKVVEEASPEVQALADVAREKVTSEEFLANLKKHQQDIPSKDAEVITLGTGSALPSKYRNVSATLLRVPGYGNYLFDCGEGTLGQMKRVFGEELPEVLRDLKVIWISHMHADHHLGIASVIRAWNEATRLDPLTKDNKLAVASNTNLLHFLREYAGVQEYGYDRVLSILMARNGKWPFAWKPMDESHKAIGLDCIQSCAVHHQAGAQAVVFHFPNGFKVAYSGDCRPSEEFAKLGQGATLLIHEATFDDELQRDAIAKKHSTTSEAIEVGRKMGARRILLTHFSQRYQKIPVMENREGKDQVVIVAFDCMRVKIGDMAKMEAFKPALMKLYEESAYEK